MKLKLFMGGTEVPKHRTLLSEGGIENVGCNFLYLRDRLPKIKPWTIEGNFPVAQNVLLDAGSYGLARKGWNAEQLESYLAEYMAFVQDNIDALAYVVESDFMQMGVDWIQAQRLDFWSELPQEKVIYTWHPEFGHKILRGMLEEYPNVGVPPLDKSDENRVGGFVRRSKASLFGLCMNHPFEVPGGLYSGIYSTSWLSTTKYGETQVWDHNKMKRYATDQKVQARKRHESQFKQAGFDAAKIIADDSDEVARYTIWAWRQLEEKIAGPMRVKVIPRPSTIVNEAPILSNGHVNGTHETKAFTIEDIDIVLAEAQSLAQQPEYQLALPAVINPLPGFDMRAIEVQVTAPDGQGMITQTQLIPALSAISVRQCDTCSLAGMCPEFEPGSKCKFSMPVEIRSRDQLMGVMKMMLEVQTQRIMFARFSEELNGGYPDANLSSEIDRLYKNIHTFKEIEDNRDFLSIRVDSRGDQMAAAGMLSRIFGPKATEPLRNIDSNGAEDVIKKAMG